MSFMATEDFVAPSVVMSPFGRLVVLNQSSTGEKTPDDRLVLDPLWIRRLRNLVSYLRGYHWCQHRIRQLREFDDNLNDLRKPLRKEAKPDTNIEDLINFGSDIEEARLEWTDLYSRVVDELDALESQFVEQTESPDDSLTGPFDIPIERSEGPGLVLPEDETNSLISFYDNGVRTLIESLQSESERVEKKQHTVAEYVNEAIQLRATDENITLQNRIRFLTWVLVGLTMVLVILTAILISM